MEQAAGGQPAIGQPPAVCDSNTTAAFLSVSPSFRLFRFFPLLPSVSARFQRPNSPTKGVRPFLTLKRCRPRRETVQTRLWNFDFGTAVSQKRTACSFFPLASFKKSNSCLSSAKVQKSSFYRFSYFFTPVQTLLSFCFQTANRARINTFHQRVLSITLQTPLTISLLLSKKQAAYSFFPRRFLFPKRTKTEGDRSSSAFSMLFSEKQPLTCSEDIRRWQRQPSCPRPWPE